MTCPRCQGLLVTDTAYEHGVWQKESRCINCGRRYSVETQTAKVDVYMGRMQDGYKPWKRVKPEVLPKVKKLLDNGYNPTEVSREVGCHVLTVRKMIAAHGWDYRSGRPNRRGKDELAMD